MIPSVQNLQCLSKKLKLSDHPTFAPTTIHVRSLVH